VASVGDAQVDKVLVLANGTSGLPSNSPGSVGSTDKARLARPLHLVEHGISTEVIADKVIFTIVEDDTDLAQDGGDQAQIGTFEVINEILINSVRAGLPGTVTNAQLCADCLLVEPADNRVEVIAQSTIALLTDIVNIDVSSSAQDDLFDLAAGIESAAVVTRVDILGAGLVLLLSLVHDAVVDEAIGIEIRSIAGSLHKRVSPAVSDGNTLQVNSTLGKNVGSNGWDVVSSIRLTSDVEWQASILGILVVEIGQEGEQIGSDLSLGSHVAVAVGDVAKASTTWAVDVEQVGKVIPTVRIGLQAEILVHGVRAVLEEKSQF